LSKSFLLIGSSPLEFNAQSYQIIFTIQGFGEN